MVTRAAVARTAVSVGLATGAYGLSFGALGTAAGLSVAQTWAMSVLMFTGGSQFALLGVLSGGGSGVSGAASAVLLGARNALYAARLKQLLGLHGLRKLLGAQLIIDESTAVAVSNEQRGVRAGRFGFWSTGLSVFVLWNLATVAGAIAGAAVGEPQTYGLDAAAPAAFLALLWPRLTSRAAWLNGTAACLVAIAVVPLVPAGVPILVAALVPVAYLALLRDRDAR